MEYNNLIDQAIILDQTDLTSTEKLVAVALLSFRNAETGRCNPPIYSENADRKTLCTRTGLSRRSVIDTIRKLEIKNVITTQKEIGKVTGYKFASTSAPRAPVQEDNPCTTCTTPVQEVHSTRAPRAPITNKEQIRTNNTIRENSPSDDFSLEPVSEDSTSQKIQSSNPLSCPYEELATLYNQVLGQDLGECRKLSPARKTALRSLWNECIKDKDFNDKDGGLAYFNRYFTFVRNTPFLVGKETAWKANFDWILKNNNYIKICEGFYNRPRNAQR